MVSLLRLAIIKVRAVNRSRFPFCFENHSSGWQAAAGRSLKGSEEHQRQSFDRQMKNFEPKCIVFLYSACFSIREKANRPIRTW